MSDSATDRTTAASGERQLSLDDALALANDHMQMGRLAAAETLCQKVLAVAPAHAPALHLYGIVAHRAGNVPAAIDLFRRAIAADDSVALYHANLGEVCRLSGRYDDALAASSRALALSPHSAQALNNLGIIHFERGSFAEAAALFRRAIDVEPGFAEAHSNLGNALRGEGRLEDAVAAYRHAIGLKPGYAGSFNNLGTTLRDMGRLGEAETAYRQALSLNPDDRMTLNNLALAVRDLGRPEEAAALLDCALRLDPGHAKTLTYLALVRLDQNRFEEAHEYARRAVAALPDDPETLNAMGLALYELGRGEEALPFYERATRCDPRFAGAYNNIGNVYKTAGKLTEAYDAYAASVAIDPRQAEVYVNLTDLKKVKAGDPPMAAMEELARGMDALPETAQMRLHFALAKAYDDQRAFKKAFHHMKAANALKRRTIAYDEGAALALFDRLRETFDRAMLDAKAGGGDPSEVPVFVLGMPRSGTTLVEQIIASHPAVFGAGELSYLGEIVEGLRGEGGGPFQVLDRFRTMSPSGFTAVGKRYLECLNRYPIGALRVTDKMPSNFCFVGLIHLALPNARIIHVTRDPVDTCLSCFSRLFSAEQNHTYELGELGRYYSKYNELMAHWRQVLPEGRMLEVRYEDVIADLEPAARRIIDYCGLDWNDACLAFHKTKRPIKTASASQVRRPIYKTSQGRAQGYREYLTPLLKELGDLAT